MRTYLSSQAVSRRTPPLLLVIGSIILFSTLLVLYPYHGLYGQDAYAYYYQGRALWQDMSGHPAPPGQLFSAEALRWPVGYHLHIAAGILLSGGPEGGRLITLLMAALAPALIYLIICQLCVGSSKRAQIAAGLTGGAVLPLTATYTRMGLSLMSDVPALFWSVLAVYCCLQAWAAPSNLQGERDQRQRRGTIWALCMGVALGVAVLVRYASGLLLVPMLLYILALRLQTESSLRGLRRDVGKFAAFFLGFALGICPQLIYLLTHTSAPGPTTTVSDYSVWLSDWKLTNIFATTLTGADGTATFPYPNIVFYIFQPFWTLNAGLLSPFYVPALLLGLGALVAWRRWPILVLLVAWWLLPALYFSGSPYQAHRFVLVYLPALAILIGIGTGVAIQRLLKASWRALWGSAHVRVASFVLIGICAGSVVGLISTQHWIAIHSSIEAQERRVAQLVRQAAGPASTESTLRVVSFNITAALYHYTGWQMLDFYNHDETEISSFIAGPGLHILVLPEQSMSTQWVGTPSGERWQWLRRSYNMQLVGKEGDYNVYLLGDRR